METSIEELSVDRLIRLRDELLPPLFRNMLSVGEPLLVLKHVIIVNLFYGSVARRDVMQSVPAIGIPKRLSYRTSKGA
jgi:hypothetical protein